jgi:hypothetical protein
MCGHGKAGISCRQNLDAGMQLIIIITKASQSPGRKGHLRQGDQSLWAINAAGAVLTWDKRRSMQHLPCSSLYLDRQDVQGNFGNLRRRRDHAPRTVWHWSALATCRSTFFQVPVCWGMAFPPKGNLP